MLDDGKPQTGAAQPAAAAFVDAVEALEHALLRLFRDADAGVRDRQDHAAVLRPHKDVRTAALHVVFDCVVQQVQHQLRHAVGVRVQKAVVPLHPDGDLLFLRLHRERFGDLAGNHQQADAPAVYLRRPRLQLGELEDVADQADHPLRLLPNQLQVAPALGRVVHDAGLHQLRKSLDGGQGGLELVGGVRKEFGANLLRAPDGGHVGNQQDHAAGLVHALFLRHGRHGNPKHPLVCGDGKVEDGRLPLPQRKLRRVGDFRVPGQAEQVLVHQVALRAEKGRGAPVQNQDAPGAVQHRHALRHVVEQVADPPALHGEVGKGAGDFAGQRVDFVHNRDELLIARRAQVFPVSARVEGLKRQHNLLQRLQDAL